MSLASGTHLGPYEILAPLGAGGMGEVYRARDTRLERTVAIKILPREMSGDPVRRQRFEREAKTISSLNHPHICVLHDVGSQDGLSYLVMECVEGETLAKRLEKGPLALEQVLKYGAQIADALDKAHRAGIVHRDLKPGNIMLTASGAKLLDFGLAKPTVAANLATLTVTKAESPVTQEGTIVGTFQYMSPEQVESKDLDGRSDIFSLGAVLYEMATGRKAFEGNSQLSVASAILEKEPAPISVTKPLTSPAFEHIVKKCLAKLPEERWQSASDLASELKWISEGSSQAGVPVPLGRQRRNRERIAALAATLAIISLAGTVAYQRLANLHAPLLISSVVPPPDNRALRWARISPDGNTLLLTFVDAQGKSMLWLRPLNSPSAEPLAGTDGAASPFWSPDGRMIGFFADGKLKTTPANGGPVQTLCDVPFPSGGSWGKDGSIIFVPQLQSGIYKISASGGSPALLLDLNKTKFSRFSFPEFQADGRHFTYAAYGLDPGFTGTYFASLDGRENRRVTQATGKLAFSDGYLFFDHSQSGRFTADLMAIGFDPASGNVDGEPKVVARGINYFSPADEANFAVSRNTLIYAASPQGAWAGPSLVWVERSGKRLSTVTGASNASDIRLSPDALKVAYAQGDPNSDLWIQELKRDVPMRMTFDTSVDKGAPVWSPDGSEILFDIALGDGKRPTGIYRKPSSGTGREELVVQPKAPGTMVWPTDWSRDGRFILAVQGEIIARHQGEIWIIPLPDRTPRVLIRAPDAAYDGQFSPDGHWVAYVSRESGREEVYVVPFDGNQVLNTPPFEQVAITSKSQLSPNGGAFPRWSRDGKELFYVAPGNQFVAVTVKTNGNAFLPGETRQLFRQPLRLSASPYDVSPDGQRFLVNSTGDLGTSPFTLVINWKELLQSK